MRYLTNKGDGEHILESTVPPVEARELTEAEQAAEDERTANLPFVGEHNTRPPVVTPDPLEHEIDPDTLGRGQVPRHDRYADENSDYPTPARVVPSTPTNANPSFADYEVVVQDKPGYADGSDAVDVAISRGMTSTATFGSGMGGDGTREPFGVATVDPTGDEAAAVEPPVVTEERPDGPVAGEGSFVVRPPTAEATGATSPIGDAHNDPWDARVADTKAEADEVLTEQWAQRVDADEPFEPPTAPAPVPVDPGDLDPPATRDADGAPAGNASTDAWREYAIAQGMDAEEAAGLNRTELRARLEDETG